MQIRLVRYSRGKCKEVLRTPKAEAPIPQESAAMNSCCTRHCTHSWSLAAMNIMNSCKGTPAPLVPRCSTMFYSFKEPELRSQRSVKFCEVSTSYGPWSLHDTSFHSYHSWLRFTPSSQEASAKLQLSFTLAIWAARLSKAGGCPDANIDGDLCALCAIAWQKGTGSEAVMSQCC